MYGTDYGYNPYGGFQQRQTTPQFVVRQVGNIEEAKSCLIDPVNVWLFIDMQAGKIYMKRMATTA